MNKITILIDTIRGHAGGPASIFDMATTLSTIGNEVHLGLISFDPFYIYRRKQLVRKKFDSEIKIHYTPSCKKNLIRENTLAYFYKILIPNIKQCILMPSKITIKNVLESILVLVDLNKNKIFEDILTQSNIIIMATPFSGKELAALRNKTKAIVIHNHAGSPQTFEQYWLRKEHLRDDADPELSPYVNFCLSFDKILFQAEDQAANCALRHPDLPDRIVTILPSCDEDLVKKSSRLPSPFDNGSKVLINVGTLQPRKAQHLSIEAFAKIADNYPNLQLHFLGSWRNKKTYYSRLLQLVENNGLKSRVFFHGHRDDHLRFMHHADILVQTSQAEGVSRVLREAMFMRLPIVSFDISGTRDILINDREALLVRPNDTVAMSHSIATLLSDKSRSQSLCKAAFEKYQRRHSRLVYSAKLQNMIQDIVVDAK
tara:strand:+ start:2286 stop:3572 length:1287 start_codon:yes stop_codon:yes gene_type:complete